MERSKQHVYLSWPIEAVSSDLRSPLGLLFVFPNRCIMYSISTLITDKEKPAYWEKTCTSVSLFTTNPTGTNWTQFSAVIGRRLPPPHPPSHVQYVTLCTVKLIVAVIWHAVWPKDTTRWQFVVTPNRWYGVDYRLSPLLKKPSVRRKPRCEQDTRCLSDPRLSP
jgi:hypothetical protein